MLRTTRHAIDPVVGTPSHDLRAPISPNRWRGETGVLIGPFARRAVAESFAGATTDFGQLGDVRFQVVAQRGTWFVDVRKHA